jgi:hypothetical protein
MKYLKVFTDFSEIIEPLQDAEVGRLFRSMLSYAESGAVPDFRGNERFVWNAAKQIIDREREFTERQTENGRKGGRPKNPLKPTETQINPLKPTETQKSQKDKDKDNTINPIGFSSKRFTPPTLQEIEAYIAEKGLSVDGKKFFAYYDTPNDKGEKWIDSKGQKVKNWKQKLLTWASHDGKEKPKGDYGFGNYQQKVVHMDELTNLI